MMKDCVVGYLRSRFYKAVERLAGVLSERRRRMNISL
jgi:hypothetical protein